MNTKLLVYLLLVSFFTVQSCGQNINNNSQNGNESTEQQASNFSLDYLNMTTWVEDCQSNIKNNYITFYVAGAQFTFTYVPRYVIRTPLKQVSKTEIEIYFKYPIFIPIPKNMQDCRDYSEEIPIGKIEPLGEKIKFTWYGFYNIKTESRVHTENPFNNEQYVVLERCESRYAK